MKQAVILLVLAFLVANCIAALPSQPDYLLKSKNQESRLDFFNWRGNGICNRCGHLFYFLAS